MQPPTPVQAPVRPAVRLGLAAAPLLALTAAFGALLDAGLGLGASLAGAALAGAAVLLAGLAARRLHVARRATT